MTSAKAEQAALQDFIHRSICKAEQILQNLAKEAVDEDTIQLPSFTANELTKDHQISTKSTSPKSSKSSKSSKKKPKKAKKSASQIAITPPIRREEKTEDCGLSLEFTMNLKKPDGEKKAFDFRVDCVNYKPIRASINGQWKDVRPAK